VHNPSGANQYSKPDNGNKDKKENYPFNQDGQQNERKGSRSPQRIIARLVKPAPRRRSVSG
jgi:hypothetical protein